MAEEITIDMLLQNKVFDADAHTRGDTLANLVTVGKAEELYFSRFWT